MQTIPTPKYQIGMVVFAAETRSEESITACAECKGSRKAKLTYGSGDEIEVPCPACEGRGGHGVHKWVATADQRTIGAVRIDTTRTDSPIDYMCVETGVGSGRLYSEALLFPTRDEALCAGHLRAVNMNEKRERDWLEEIKSRKTRGSGITMVGHLIDQMRAHERHAERIRKSLDEKYPKWKEQA